MDDVDEFYRQPGVVPFKWEIKPGVPRIHQQLCHCNHHQLRRQVPQQQLKPPPAVSHSLRPSASMSRSFHSSPRTRSDRWRFSQTSLAQTQQVSAGCFPSPLPKRKSSKSVVQKPGSSPKPDYTSEPETLSRWSVSSRKSFSLFRESLSSSPWSYHSSPRPTSDAEWAGFGLF